MIPIFSP
ncbi:hypothetical protein AVEN_13128-1, partial [Araneus ventricosus]